MSTLRCMALSIAVSPRCSSQATPNQKRQVQQTPRLVDLSRRQLLSGGVLGSICACCPPLVLPPQPAKAEAWGYITAGPAIWDGACNAGVNQSPIDIPLPLRPRQAGLESIKFSDYPQFVTAEVTNPGHGTMQVKPKRKAVCLIGGEPHELVQWHFHTPSEHTLSKQHAAMEGHLVHRNMKTGGLAVLGVMIQPGGAALTSLDAILRYAPTQAGVPPVRLPRPISVLELLPRPTAGGRRTYATYSGSLTTPPCSEGVSWYIFLDPLRISAEQIMAFQYYAGNQVTLGNNARPLQPVNNRTVRCF